MKNEKYRLQIKKSSLLAFAKAYEHMLTGGSNVARRAFSIMEEINASSDVMEFVRTHRKPYQRSERIHPAYHSNDILKDALSEYYRTKDGSPASIASEERKTQRSPTSMNSGSPLKRNQQKSPVELEMRTLMHGENRVQGSEGSSSPEKSNERGAASAVESSESENDAQALGVSDFQKKFQVEKVVAHL